MAAATSPEPRRTETALPTTESKSALLKLISLIKIQKNQASMTIDIITKNHDDITPLATISAGQIISAKTGVTKKLFISATSNILRFVNAINTSRVFNFILHACAHFAKIV